VTSDARTPCSQTVRARRTVTLLVGLVVATLLATATPARATASGSSLPLVRVRDVPLPGHATRFDYQAVDNAAHRLSIAHLGDSQVDIVDLATFRVTAQVHDVDEVHGVAVASDRGRLYATATGSDELAVIDTVSGRVTSRVRTGKFPDGVAYDSDDGLVLVSNKNDGSVTVVDARTDTVLRTVHIARETGNVVYDPRARLAYVSARPPDALVGFDPAQGDLVARVPLPGCRGAHGVYVEEQPPRAFIACEDNARLVTVDLVSGRRVAAAPVGRNPDVLALDGSMQRLYVASESGIVSVFSTSSAKPQAIGEGRLARAAHSVAVDQTTHRVFFPLEDVRGRPVLRVMKPAARP